MFLFNLNLFERMGVDLKDRRLRKGYQILWMDEKTNQTIKTLREKLEKKSYEVAKQYNTIENHKAAIVALDNFVINFPGTPFKEKALYYKLEV